MDEIKLAKEELESQLFHHYQYTPNCYGDMMDSLPTSVCEAIRELLSALENEC